MKLLDLLVKELPKRGGWPDGVAAMAQDANGAVQNYRDTYDIRIDSQHAFGTSRIIGNYSIAEDEVSAATDRLTSIITRAQYEAALAKNDGWIEWGGGECPVEAGSLVDVRYRDGQELSALPAKGIPTGGGDASRAFWHNDGGLNDITAYRLHKPGINSLTNDDRLEQDLNECIGQDVDMPEWSGYGLPPVGTECEIYNRSEWFAVKIKFIGDKWIVAEPLDVGNEGCFENQFNGEDCYSIADNPHAFRPLRTEAEKAIEAATQSILDILNDYDFEMVHIRSDQKRVATDIVERIFAGQVSGIKSEGK